MSNIRQQIKQLFQSGNDRVPLRSRLRVTDENGDTLSPTEVMDESDVCGAFIELDNGKIHVRRIFGRWECLSCSSDCNHAQDILAVVEDWARINERRKNDD